ncbi:MAG: sn-glycerol-3-phosphate ABC transporter ATP-binding protein UgpC [Lachnospiraceae bacterium]|nr:sn-glycerol-3-phosphate ABC transporter ATP-binding protein UgpC [Lachnospiraceae bacterium]
MAAISLKNIFKVYPGDVTAVHDFNLEIHDKEFIVFVGPSGCGKSTTLRMIAGLEEITEGELYIGNKLVNDVAPKDRDIAMVFQNYALYPHMSVYENMAFGLKLKRVPKAQIDEKIKEAAKILHLEEYLNRKPKALSGGQRQRVALGRAMVRNPAVFLLDEPLSNLDAKLRTTMRSEISKLHKKLETTFIYVTHDQIEAMTMGDRIVVMKDGFIQQVNTPQNLYNKPCNLFVAGFIGTPPMNFLKAKVEKEKDDYFVSSCNAKFPVLESRIEKEKIAPFLGKEVILGIRPEDLHIEPVYMEQKSVGVFEADLDLVELMGSELYLYLNTEGNNFISKVPARYVPKQGEKLQVALDCTKMHIFDTETEKNIVFDE